MLASILGTPDCVCPLHILLTPGHLSSSGRDMRRAESGRVYTFQSRLAQALCKVWKLGWIAEVQKTSAQVATKEVDTYAMSSSRFV